jgi:hypothetical protein
MKNLNNSLFKKFESNKINNLAKVIGGAATATKLSNGSCDSFVPTADGPCNTRLGYITWPDGTKEDGDLYIVDC